MTGPKREPRDSSKRTKKKKKKGGINATQNKRKIFN
jgi:hypothetical protein